MANKFTPAPWKVEYQQYEKVGFPGTETHVCVADANGDWIADCGGEGDEQPEANARLIAAAPKLLEALKQARNILSLIPVLNFEEENNLESGEVMRVFQKVLSAIQAATAEN